MNCARCRGWVYDFDDGDGPHCMNCGRSPAPPLSQADLWAAGILQDTVGKRREMVGRHGPQGAEYSPAHVGLVRPLSKWRG